MGLPLVGKGQWKTRSAQAAGWNSATVSNRIGGACGGTAQAVAGAGLLHDLRYHAALLSLAALKSATLPFHLRFKSSAQETLSGGRSMTRTL